MIQVIPGYQGMNAAQRSALLDLAEAGELQSPVQVRELAGRAWRAADRRGSRFVIYTDGTHDRIAI